MKEEAIELEAIWYGGGFHFCLDKKSSKIEDYKIINFWKKVDEFGVWKWHKKYPYWKQKYQQLPDGCDWKLKLRDRNGRAKYCSGYESFPRNFKDLIKELIDGINSDISFKRYKNNQELLRYCYKVAGVVGLMMVKALDIKEKEAKYFAIDLGIAMQLTNIARDVKEDAIYGRRYIPKTLCRAMTPDEILISASGNDPQGREIIKKSINHILTIAEEYYDSGLSGLAYLPIRNHIAIGIAAIIYRQIGRKLVKRGTRWWQGRQIVSFAEKFIYSFFIIITLFSRLKSYPIHNKSLHLHLKRFQNINGS